MVEKSCAARHASRAARPGRDANIIQQEFERGSLIGGLLVALMAGIPMLMWAVM